MASVNFVMEANLPAPSPPVYQKGNLLLHSSYPRSSHNEFFFSSFIIKPLFAILNLQFCEMRLCDNDFSASIFFF